MKRSAQPLPSGARTRDGEDFAEEVTTFLPVKIAGPTAPHVPITAPCMDGPLSAHRVDIILSDGRRILVEGATGLSAVPALVEGLMT